LELLKNTFKSVLGQTLPPDRVIIVDNHSADGTIPWLKKMAHEHPSVIPLFMEENAGGAGGFHYGIKKAYETGAEWIWTLDDDCQAEPDALEKLMSCGIIGHGASDRAIGFLASQVNWSDGTPHQMNVPGPAKDWTSHPPNCPCSVKLRYASFVSLLINTEAVRRAGLPIKEFFLYCDDVEYTRRITSAGFSGYYVEASRVAHLTPSNQGITMERITAHPPRLARRELIIRNLVAVNKDEPFGFMKETARILWIWMKLLTNKTPFKTQCALVLTGIKGLCFNCQKWIEYPRD
jgi:hypothetical protein